MTKYIAVIFLAVLVINVRSQTVNNYLADLTKLDSLLRRTPSFKDQVKENKLKEYKALYEHLRRDTVDISSDYAVFYKLAQLFFLFRDNHLSFYQLPTDFLNKSSIKDSTAIKEYRQRKAFINYPRSGVNLDSLEAALKRKPKDSIEGIYYYDKYLKVGLSKTNIEHQYTGVVLATLLPHWEKGQIAIRLYEYLPGYFRAVYAHPVYKGLFLYNNEKFRNQSLINSHFYASVTESVYKKNPGEIDFVNIRKAEPPFQFSKLGNSIQYLRLGNFSATTSDMKVSQQFYEGIKDSLTASNLIVDLRNNTGGAFKVSGKFFELIKAYTTKGKVYVLINNGTMSQGEIVTLQLKKLSNIRIYGQTTMGTIAYGTNYGTIEKLPSGKFQVSITDMEDSGNYLQYESYGVVPDVFLKNDLNWIDQIIREIKK